MRLVLVAVLVACACAQTTKEMVNSLLQTYGNPGNTGTPVVGSIIVNQVHHLKNEAQRSELLNEKARYAARNKGLPLIVSTDQEGGAVSRIRLLNPGFKFYSPAEMATMSLDAIRAHGVEVGKRVLASGVNMLLAPTLDVADAGTLMAKQGRAFGSSVDEVTKRGQAWVDGIRTSFPDLIVIAKHFPGYNFRGNSDIQAVTSKESIEGVRNRVQPFLNVRGLSGVMMNSARYAAFGDEVAAFSADLISIYRLQNPNGIVMTDDIVAPSLVNAALKGAARNEAIAEVAFKAFKAGCDIILAMDGAAMPAIATLISQRIDTDMSGVLRAKLLASYDRVQRARRALAGGAVSAPATPAVPSPRVTLAQQPAASSAPAAPASPCVTDRDTLMAAQSRLVSKGLLASSVDGKWGPRSQAALVAWLNRNRLPVTACLTSAVNSMLQAS